MERVLVLVSGDQSGSEVSGQDGDARLVVFTWQLPLLLGQEAEAVHQVREEKIQLNLQNKVTTTNQLFSCELCLMDQTRAKSHFIRNQKFGCYFCPLLLNNQYY